MLSICLSSTARSLVLRVWFSLKHSVVVNLVDLHHWNEFYAVDLLTIYARLWVIIYDNSIRVQSVTFER